MMTVQMQECQNPECVRKEPNLRRGLCSPCYQWWRRHNCLRPAGKQKSNARTELRECRNPECGRSQLYLRRGLCGSCYLYWRKNDGALRPASKTKRSCLEGRRFCSNCKRAIGSRRSNLCDACRQYKRVNGVRRPSYLWREECSNCGRPKSDKMGLIKGRCQTCSDYHLRHGEERPQHLIDVYAPNGFCECGNKAIVTAKLTRGGGGWDREIDESYKLCAECAAEEGIDVCQN